MWFHYIQRKIDQTVWWVSCAKSI